MPILASEALLRKNKKFQWQNVTPSEDWTWTSDSKSNTPSNTYNKFNKGDKMKEVVDRNANFVLLVI